MSNECIRWGLRLIERAVRKWQEQIERDAE